MYKTNIAFLLKVIFKFTRKYNVLNQMRNTDNLSDPLLLKDQQTAEIGVYLFKLFNQLESYLEKCQYLATRISLNFIDTLLLQGVRAGDLSKSISEYILC